jgi:hypothetical protein
MPENNKKNNEKRLYDTLRNDIREGGFTKTLSNEFADVKEYFLNEERKQQLSGMGRIKSFFYMAWWLLKELLFKLTPVRRLLLVVGIFLTMSTGSIGIHGGDSFTVSRDTSFLGGIVILFILMLELKDKLIAKDELSVGKSVQSELTPKCNHSIPGWEIWLYTNSANEVGGDLVDIIELDKHKYGITIADVSGKGLGAALLMAKLQTIIRAFAPDYNSLSEFGKKINNAFYKDILPNSFASMAHFQIVENSPAVEILNAGHLPPMILNNGKVTELNKGNIALGLVEDSTYKTETIKLNSGEYLIAFSDGLTEARNIYGTFFGTERLKIFLQKINNLSVEQLGQKLLNYIHLFIDEAKMFDDLSIVIIKKL